MTTVRMICSFLKGATDRNRVRRRDRVQCQPSGEQMEPRAMLSALEVGLSTLVPPSAGGGTLVIRASQATTFSVTYQMNLDGNIADDTKDQINVENDALSGP
jgi:hypothetical protein